MPRCLIVARCEVTYAGLPHAFLPESTRPVTTKADGSVLVHADAGRLQASQQGQVASGMTLSGHTA
jgi:RecB family endonuclease NucS